MSENLNSVEMNDLAEKVGDLVYLWGLKRVSGRIWTHLLLSSEPLDAYSITKALDISKALVSITLKELIDLNAVYKVGKNKIGSESYRANHDIHSIIVSVLRRRERILLSNLLSSHAGLSKVFTKELSKADISVSQLDLLKNLILKTATFVDRIINLRTNTDSLDVNFHADINPMIRESKD